MSARLWMDTLPDQGGVEVLLAEGMDEDDLRAVGGNRVLGSRARFHSCDSHLAGFILARLGDIYDYGCEQ